MSKKQLGQFYTTNYIRIFDGFRLPKDVEYIEPFAGNGDLVKYVRETLGDSVKIECYDIDPKQPFIIKRDTIADPPCYKNKFVITNPPYLARNKSKDKTYFDKYDVNDLYKCLIKQLITDVCSGAIIIPLNFWSSIRRADIELRKEFLSIYQIDRFNIFEEQMFDDTTYTVCSFQFSPADNKKIVATVYPSLTVIECDLCDSNNYMFGGEIYKLPQSKYVITRLTKKNIADANTNILAKCIDDNDESQIGLKYDSHYVDNTANQSARTYATLVINPPIDENAQKKLIKSFNEYLSKLRKRYCSLFLTNYRESKRKRISFDLVYSIVSYLLSEDELVDNLSKISL